MDIDETMEVEMAVTPAPDPVPVANAVGPYSGLAALFEPFPFTPETISYITARRASLGNELVIDQLLEQASISSPAYLFPPASLDGLRELLTAIENSSWDAQKKRGLCFYLLAYVDLEVAQTATALPPHFAALAHACFLLDRGDVPSLQQAVALLADARIVQDLAPKILQTLNSANEPRLIRTYVRTAHPVLQAFEDVEIYLRALLNLSLSEAWSYQRGFIEGSDMRNRLVRVILDSCLMPPHPIHLPHLLSLPLSAYESALLQAYALSPPAELTQAAHLILQDLLTVRMLSAGKYSDAIWISRAFSEKVVETAQADQTAAKALAQAASERRSTMRAVLNVLPAVQRRELEKEFEDSSDSAMPKHNGIHQGGRSGENRDRSLSGSWEDLAHSSMYASMYASKGRAGQLEGSPAPGGSGFLSTSNREKRLFNFPFTTASPVTKGVLPVRTPTKGTPSMQVPMIPTSKSTPTLSTKLPPTTNNISPSSNITPRGSLVPTIFANTTKKPSTVAPALNDSLKKIPAPPAANMFPPAGRFGIQATPTLTPPPFGPRGSSTGLFSDLNLKRSSSTTSLLRADSTPEGNRTGLFDAEKNTAKPVEEDIIMVDSDDPDAFVVHGRKRQPFRRATPPEREPEKRSEVQNQERKDTSSPTLSTSRLLPGGLESFELREEQPSSPPQRRSSRQRQHPVAPSKESTRPQKSSRFQIPGAFHDEPCEEEEAEETGQRQELKAEEDDVVSSLPPIVAPPKIRSRSRLSTGSTESGDDGSEPKLRRSSRLSTASPQKKPTSKKPNTTTGTGTKTKKRKAGDA